MRRRYLKKLERIKSEKELNSYNDTPSQLEAINKFYSQFVDEPYFQMSGNYTGPHPEVLIDSWMLTNYKCKVDNTMDSKCIKSSDYCDHQCVIDTWEVSCSNFNYRKENCL